MEELSHSGRKRRGLLNRRSDPVRNGQLKKEKDCSNVFFEDKPLFHAVPVQILLGSALDAPLLFAAEDLWKVRSVKI
jgi:hypothetical protein